MDDKGDLLSRGQASRNRELAGKASRIRVLLIAVLAFAALGAFVGWQSADRLERDRAAAYWSIWWSENSNPYSGNLEDTASSDRTSEYYLSESSPLTRAMRSTRNRMALLGTIFGLGLGIPFFMWRRRSWEDKGREAGEAKTIRGDEIVDPSTIRELIARKVSPKSVSIGAIPISIADEARHFLMAGATGTGKTTAIWEMLDKVEQRGDHAFVHDVDGSYVSRYYRSERGDIILNPFDKRCAYWNPFSDVQSAADADRLASFIVAKPTGSSGGGDDVWYDQARIVVGAVIRRLWEQGRGEVDELTRALRDLEPDELRELTKGTEAARVFQKDAEKATASVLFCLADAAKIMGALKRKPDGGAEISFDAFYRKLKNDSVPNPWIFLASRKRNFAAAKPLLGCWLDCAIASILDRPLDNPPRAWLILDELPALPRATGLLQLLPEGRKFGAAVVIAFQAIGQLRETYGQNAAGTMVGQTSTQLIMRLGDPESTRWATQLLGQSEIEERRVSETLDSDDMSDKGSLSSMKQTKMIVLDSEISKLVPLTGILRLSGLPITKVEITRSHMDRPPIAEPTIPIDSFKPAAPSPAGWTDGGAL